MRARPTALVAVLAVLVAGACGGPSPSPVPSPTPSAAVAPSPTVTAPPSATPPSSSGSVLVDPTLLDVLPAAVAGLDRTADAETAAELAAGPGIADSVAALALALYAGPGPSTAEEDLAIVSVARLLDGVAGDAWFREWRDTYDVAACEPAGGVASGGAQAEIDGRTVYIGTCQNGVHTYHVLLRDPDRVVSITALGDDRIGEQVVGGLTE